MPSTAPPQRLFFADWLRIGAFALLVVYHVGMVYVPWQFHIKHNPTYPGLEAWMRLSNPWRMSLLFVVSGLATGMMLGRPGLVRERSRRLLWPLLFGIAVVVPPQAWLQARDQYGLAGGYLDFLRLYFSAYPGFCDARGCLILPTWNHLWFLPYLWCYTVLMLAALRWLPAAPLRRWADVLGRSRGLLLLVAPMLMLGLLRLALFPRFGDTHALVDDFYNHAAYGPLFCFGVLLARRRTLLDALQALRWPALACALAAWAGFIGLEAMGAPAPEALPWVRPALRLLYAAQQWSALVAALGFARAHLNVDHRWRAPLTEAVFPLYIVHQTIIIGAAVALRPLALTVGVEALVIAALSFAGGFAAWQAARRARWLRPCLGLKAAPSAAAAGAPAPLTSRQRS